MNQWTYTKDHKPSFEEAKGKGIVYHLASFTPNEISAGNIDDESDISLYFEKSPIVDRYILIDIPEAEPEPVKCKLNGETPTVMLCVNGRWMVSAKNVVVYGTTKAEAIENWNKLNG